MSALGHKQTFGKVRPMSALPPKADIVQHDRDVRFVPIADIVKVTRSPRRRRQVGPREWQAPASKRTSLAAMVMSALCQKQTSCVIPALVERGR
jgi:hypothetical protein